MIRLPYTGTYSLELVTAQNGAQVVVCYSDATSTAYTGGTQVTSVTSATTTAICATPAASTIRDVDSVNIKNTYAGSHTITVQIDANGTNYPIITASLAQDESLNYTHGSGWQCKDANGNTKGTSINLTGDVTSIGNSTTIASGVVTNAKLANVATATLKGRTTAGTGSPEDLTATQATALLNAMVGDAGAGGTKGLVPVPAAGDATKFLRGDATWAAAGGGGVTWVTKTSGYTAVSGNFILADTSSAGFTITLPATPSANDFVVIKSGYSASPSKILTIARNGSEIMNLAEDMTVTTPNIEMTLVYNATTGWTL